MSYAGEYGPADTCEHALYRRNCWRCNGDVQRFAREFPEHESHVAALPEEPPITERVVVLYETSCPGCSFCPGTFSSREAAEKAWRDHADRARATLAEWRADEEMWAEVRRQE